MILASYDSDYRNERHHWCPPSLRLRLVGPRNVSGPTRSAHLDGPCRLSSSRRFPVDLPALKTGTQAVCPSSYRTIMNTIHDPDGSPRSKPWEAIDTHIGNSNVGQASSNVHHIQKHKSPAGRAGTATGVHPQRRPGARTKHQALVHYLSTEEGKFLSVFHPPE